MPPLGPVVSCGRYREDLLWSGEFGAADSWGWNTPPGVCAVIGVSAGSLGREPWEPWNEIPALSPYVVDSLGGSLTYLGLFLQVNG